MLSISVIIPFYRDEKYLTGCLGSIKDQQYDLSDIEVIISVVGSTKKIQAWVKKYRKFFSLKVVVNSQPSISAQLNKAIRAAKGRYLVRVDVHSKLKKDYLIRIYQHLRTGRYACVGGRRVIVGNSFWQRKIAFCYNSTWFGLGYRFSRRRKLVDNVYFGAWRREDLLEKGWFDERFFVAEDYEHCIRIKRKKGKILYDPKIIFFYYPRDNLADLAWQYFNYGRGKYLVLRKYPRQISFRQAASPLLVLFFPFTLLPYLALNLFFSIYYQGFNFWAVSVIFLIMHWSWGMGFWAEAIKSNQAGETPKRYFKT